MMVRLQKVIAASGIASRRSAETMIRDGRVTVNGDVVRVLGTRVDPETDHVKVNGRHVRRAEPEAFVLLYKPPGYVTTMSDPHGRHTVADLLGGVGVRVVPVGRLDYDAEGLLLLTNNGMVGQACLHPRYHVPKTYLVKVSGLCTNEEIRMLQDGIMLDDGMTLPAMVRKSGKAKINSWLELTLHEGRHRQVKRMIEALGHHVMRIKRIRFGPLALGELRIGDCRFATDPEANALRAILHRPKDAGARAAASAKASAKARARRVGTPGPSTLSSRDTAPSARRPPAGRGTFNRGTAKRDATGRVIVKRRMDKRDVAGRGTVSRETAKRDAAGREMVKRIMDEYDATGRNSPNRGMSDRAPAGRGTPNRGMPNRAPAGRGTPNRGMSNRPAAGRAMPNRGMPNRAPAGRATPNRGTPNRAPAGRGTPNRGMSNRSPAGRGTPNRGMSNRPAAGRGTPNRGTPNRAPAGRTTPNRNTPKRYAPKRATSKRNTPKRGASGRSAKQRGRPRER